MNYVSVNCGIIVVFGVMVSLLIKLFCIGFKWFGRFVNSKLIGSSVYSV